MQKNPKLNMTPIMVYITYRKGFVVKFKFDFL
jgi:hypothetical protein